MNTHSSITEFIFTEMLQRLNRASTRQVASLLPNDLQQELGPLFALHIEMSYLS